MNIVSLLISIASVIVAIIVGYGQIKVGKEVEQFTKRQDARDEKRREAEIFAESTRFIQKYSSTGPESEIRLIPLCIAAYKYNPTYPYRREIYREFCGLTEDVQNGIIKRLELDLNSKRVEDYYSLLLEHIKLVISHNYPNDMDLFYESGKYLEGALKNHGEKIEPKIDCDLDFEAQQFQNSKYGAFLNNKDTMDFGDHITNMLAYHKDVTPIKVLFSEQTSLGAANNGDEIITSYLACLVATYAVMYNCNPYKEDLELGFVEDYQGQKYMEDLFLESLHIAENYSKEK